MVGRLSGLLALWDAGPRDPLLRSKRTRKGEVFAYVGLSQNLEDLKGRDVPALLALQPGLALCGAACQNAAWKGHTKTSCTKTCVTRQGVEEVGSGNGCSVCGFNAKTFVFHKIWQGSHFEGEWLEGPRKTEI